MAINYITVNATRALGAELLALSNNLRSDKDRLSKLKAMLDQMTDAVDYSAIEAQVGLPAGKGVLVYNLVAGALADLNANTNVPQLTDRITFL